MIEVLPDMPAGVTGFRVSGRLRGEDLREFKPAMDDMVKAGEIRIVEVIASDYEGFGPGGLVEDLKLGLGALFQHHSAFKRIAVVTDKEWIGHTLHALAWMVPGEIALFGDSELERAPRSGQPAEKPVLTAFCAWLTARSIYLAAQHLATPPRSMRWHAVKTP